MTDETITPSELAVELRRSQKTIRAWLRATYPRSGDYHQQPWHLSREQADAARAHFGGGASSTKRRANSMMRQAVDDRWPRA